MILWLVVLLPISGAGAAIAAPRWARSIAPTALAVTAALGVWAAAVEASSVVAWGPRLALTLAATDFARAMVVLVPAIALPIALYAGSTEASGRVRLIALLTAFVGAMEMLVLAEDLLTLLIGWELVGAFSWVLIAHDWGEADNVRKAAHAFITTRVGDLGLYVAAGMAFASTGSFAFSRIGDAGAVQLQVAAAGIVVAAAAKSAQVPFSPWLFSAMAGPTPVSALLHSSTMVAAGAYLLVRLAPRLEAVEWFAPALITIGLASALAGGVVAAVHRHPKRLLAASTTAQYGLMFVAVGAGSALAAGAHLVAHAAFKSLLFLTAGTAMYIARSDDLGDMRLGRRLPATRALAAIGALALVALPPLGAAWSKEQIASAAFDYSPLAGAGVLMAGLLSAFYGLRYWLLAFGPGPAGATETTTPVPVRAAIGLLTLLTLGLSVLWLPAVNEAVARLLPGEFVPAHALEFALGFASLVAAAGLVIMLWRRAELAQGVLPRAAAVAAGGWFRIAEASRRIVVDPALSASRILAGFDDRIIDAGIRASARIASGFSRLLRGRFEVSLDAIVNGIAGGMLRMATGSRITDDRGVDRAVECLALGLGRAGEWFRTLQTGLSHHYYVIVAVGLIALVGALALGTS